MAKEVGGKLIQDVTPILKQHSLLAQDKSTTLNWRERVATLMQIYLKRYIYCLRDGGQTQDTTYVAMYSKF